MKPNFPHSPGGMHKQDVVNLILFLGCALALWFAYDRMVLRPRAEAMRIQTIQAEKTRAAPLEAGSPQPAKIRAISEVVAEGPRIALESDQLSGSIALKGARIDDVALKNFSTTLQGKERVTLYAPSGTKEPYYAETGWIAEDAAIALPDRNTVWKNVSGQARLTPQTPVTLEWDNGAGLTFRRKLEIDPAYLVTVTQGVTNNSGKPVTLYPYAAITRKGIPQHDQTIGYEGPIGYVGDELYEIKYGKVLENPDQIVEGFNGWIGMSQKYWLTALIPDQATRNTFRFTAVPAPEEDDSLFQVDSRGAAVTLPNGGTGETVSHIFMGAK
jgi:YidC/Oxa1 family membrane protein insertase